MKIALVSDTHGVCRKELFDHIKNCDYLIHTGDFDNERTYNRFLNCGIPMYAVRGNCDHGEWASYLHEFVSVPINGKLFYLVHNKADLPFDLTDADFNFRTYPCIHALRPLRKSFYQSGQRRG